jgi:hypothetical protein
VIALRRPEDYSPEQGARFEIHFEKLRNRGRVLEPNRSKRALDHSSLTVAMASVGLRVTLHLQFSSVLPRCSRKR